MNNIIIEACVDSVDSALNAQDGGANRVELCDNILEGGTTPGYGSIVLARKKLNIDLFIMIRPRGGDFLYSDTEFEIMMKEVETAKDLGADGVVLGILKADGTVDHERCEILKRLAFPMKTTFHRAFDLAADPLIAMETIIDIGIDRILTSGQSTSVPEGINLISSLINKADKRIIIMPGGGVNEENIANIIDKTGAKELHVSLRSVVKSNMIFKTEGIFMGKGTENEYVRKVTSIDRIKKIRHIVDN